MNRVKVVESHVGTQTSVDVRGKVAVITLQNPPLNAISFNLCKSLAASLDKAEQAPGVEVIVITGKGRAFSAGADITEFSNEPAQKSFILPQLLDRLEASKKVVVAAVNGMALGGGCEIALGCHYRVASAKAVFGLPEVKIGLLPGAGGTQRLPRLVGPQAAIQMACVGETISASAALKIGLIDQVVTDGDFVAAASAFALRIGKPRRICEDSSKILNVDGQIFKKWRQQLSKSPLTAPQKCLSAIEASTTHPNDFAGGMAAEAKLFLECTASPQSAALRHVFFAERAALRIPGVPANITLPKINKVGVIGGGTMGGGIAMNFLKIGIPVIMLETSPERKEFAIKTIADNYLVSVSRKRLTEEGFKKRMALLTVVINDYAALQDVDYVIEAVFESMALKKEIFAKLDQACKPNTILASNTSTLSIDEIATATRRPNKVIGAHFFSPANAMPLLEFVRGKATDRETMAVSIEIGKLIKKKPVMVGNCFGFVSNRVMFQCRHQTFGMLEEGSNHRAIDAVILKFGYPIGIFGMQDLAGLDVYSRVMLEMPADIRPKRDVNTLHGRLVDAGRLGQKTQKGWYTYSPSAPRVPVFDPAIDAIVLAVSAEKGFKRREITDKEILERYLFAMVNESALCLQEGFAIRPSDVDIIFIHGFGFPAYRGGPCHYADHLGLPNVVAAMQVYNKALGDDTFPKPCALLLDLVKNGKSFADLNKK